MKGIWVVNLRKVKPLIFICVTAFFVASWLVFQQNYISVFSTPAGPQAFYKADDADNSLRRLTAGAKKMRPSMYKIITLNTLFFLSASWAETYPELVEEIVDAGYQIGSHGYQYKNYPSLSDTEVTQDMQRSKQVLQELTGETPTLIRPPNGAFNTNTLQLAEAQNLDVIHWSVNSYDYENPGTDKIVSNVVNETQSGDILMFHASDSVKQTESALPIILKTLEQRDYSFATISEMMSDTDATSEEVE
ncbi:LOW QUALITY PROTEIN: polysaccharide deacetylase [Bacillus sp. JCM 19046]|nr:LOW QUALITY PROTEIN: polysaccharide deacetylase [Bacillus sp. JCM 19046]